MEMMTDNKKITFDRFARGVTAVLGCGALIWLINYLSGVLLPFFVAILLAYLVYPLVAFIQYKMKVKNRALSIVIALVLVVAILTGVLYLIIPPMIEQFEKLGVLATNYVKTKANITGSIPAAVSQWVAENQEEVTKFFKSSEFTDILKNMLPKVYNFVGQTTNVVISIVASLITLMYLFFILLDYEELGRGFVKIFPKKNRPFVKELLGDVQKELNNYVRGQGTVALIMGVLFCIGLSIIDFPVAIGLGILIGILDLVPYLHGVALVPMAFLALFKAADTGQNFWVIMGSAVIVFCVVQVIIDMVVTPRVMGKAMRLNPAVLLLALSVWGYLLGFIGLIIALPLTTLIIAYYKKYVTRENEEEKEAAVPDASSDEVPDASSDEVPASSSDAVSATSSEVVPEEKKNMQKLSEKSER